MKLEAYIVRKCNSQKISPLHQKKNEVNLHKQDIINVENQSYILIFIEKLPNWKQLNYLLILKLTIKRKKEIKTRLYSIKFNFNRQITP